MFVTPSRDYRILLAIQKLFFSSQKYKGYLVICGRKLNLDYKNNVLVHNFNIDSFGYCNIAGKILLYY